MVPGTRYTSGIGTSKLHAHPTDRPGRVTHARTQRSGQLTRDKRFDLSYGQVITNRLTRIGHRNIMLLTLVLGQPGRLISMRVEIDNDFVHDNSNYVMLLVTSNNIRDNYSFHDWGVNQDHGVRPQRGS